ncbi:MAG TPA: glycosyltransferase family 4 protein [Steroidobacteraceae bacterium]|nr:glycosyltransferase family 4 protein [Steroidobacteraceae bacterium]
MPGANAAIFYQHEAFSTTLPKLMGRNAAGAGFLSGFARHADVERFVAYARTQQEFEHFQAAVGREKPAEWVAHGDVPALTRAGTLFVYSPGLADLGWLRSPAGSGAFGLVGLTHTISSDRVMEDFGRLLTAPLEPWDALICTSQTVKAVVEGVLERWGEFLAARLEAKAVAPRLQLPVIPLGVDCDSFAVSPAARAEFRAQHGIGAEEVAFLFLGRLSFHAKAHPLPMYLALEAAAKRTGKPLALILAGYFFNEAIRGSFLDGARRFCPSVRLVHVDARNPAERAGAWAAADVFTSFSDNIQESFGLAPVEAMAAGLPAVVSDWDGYRDTVLDGETGFCVPSAMPRAGNGFELAQRYLAGADTYDHYIGQAGQSTAIDVGAATEAYVALIGDPALRRRLGDAGRERARRYFDWAVIVRRYQDLWRELADARRRAPGAPGRPYPLRDDPFRTFAPFPSFTIGPATRVETVAVDPAAEVRRIAASGMNSFGLPLLLTREEMDRLVQALARRKVATAGDLVGGFPAARQAAAIRTLGWLAKGNIVRLVRAEGPARL